MGAGGVVWEGRKGDLEEFKERDAQLQAELAMDGGATVAEGQSKLRRS
jgi:hypothetical protein